MFVYVVADETVYSLSDSNTYIQSGKASNMRPVNIPSVYNKDIIAKPCYTHPFLPLCVFRTHVHYLNCVSNLHLRGLMD